MKIVEVLEQINDWKKLALQLDMKQGVINNIRALDDMVIKFCNLKGDVPVKDVVATIAEALREIGNVKQAELLERKFPGGIVITSGAFTITARTIGCTCIYTQPPYSTGIPGSTSTVRDLPPKTVSNDRSSPTTRPPSETSTPSPPSEPSHTPEHSFIERIEQYFTDLTNVEIVIGGVVSLILVVLAMLLHYCCSNNSEFLSHTQIDCSLKNSRLSNSYVFSTTETRTPPSSPPKPPPSKTRRMEIIIIVSPLVYMYVFLNHRDKSPSFPSNKRYSKESIYSICGYMCVFHREKTSS